MQVAVAQLRQIMFHFTTASCLLAERLWVFVPVFLCKCYISRIMELSSRHYHILLKLFLSVVCQVGFQ